MTAWSKRAATARDAVLSAQLRLPRWRDLEEGELVPTELIGSTIVSFGAAPSGEIEGGGLLVKFIPHGEATAREIVFGFNELGMWIET
jgi:hypothetical protein